MSLVTVEEKRRKGGKYQTKIRLRQPLSGI